jgi:hypothetical protein
MNFFQSFSTAAWTLAFCVCERFPLAAMSLTQFDFSFLLMGMGLVHIFCPRVAFFCFAKKWAPPLRQGYAQAPRCGVQKSVFFAKQKKRRGKA